MKTRIKNTITLADGRRMVCRIFDLGSDGPVDRYTVAFKGYSDGRTMFYPYLAASDTPFHPQGFGQYAESDNFLTGRRLGRRIRFDDAPEQLKRSILQYFTN